MSESSAEPRWVCLSLNQNAIREGDLLERIKREMQSIFKNDLHEMVVMCDKLSKEIFEMNVENYLFVKVANYFDHLKELKDNTLIFGVLDTYESPAYIPEEEVSKFRDSMKHKFNVDDLKLGDVVTIKEGYLKNLKGVVMHLLKNGRYKVLFKFHTYSFVEIMYRKNLVYLSNIFDIEHIRQRYSLYVRNLQKNENHTCVSRRSAPQKLKKKSRNGKI